jgi:hypothetical protein
MMSKFTVDLDLSIEQLVSELVPKIGHCGPLDAARVFRALSEVITDESLKALRGVWAASDFQRFADIADTFAQRVRAVARRRVDVPEEEP